MTFTDLTMMRKKTALASIECHCQGYRKWNIAQYSALSAKEAVNFLNWNPRFGYDQDVLFNGYANCQDSCNQIEKSSTGIVNDITVQMILFFSL